MSNLEIAIQYSQDLLEDKIPSCFLVKHAALRFLDDISEDSLYFIDIDELNTIVDFSQSFYLTEVHPPTLTVLQPFQIWVLANVWGIKNKETLRKKYRLANISVARGNAKTQLIALLCVYELLYGYDAQVIIAGVTAKSTMEVDFDKIKKLCLQKDPGQKHIKIYYNKIVYKTNKIVVTSNESKPFDGASGSLMMLDEMHLFTENNIYGTMRSSMIKRTDNILFIISTAGFSTDTEYYRLCQYSEKVLKGEVDDASHFAAIFTIDPDDYYAADLYDNPKYIEKANPMLGVSVQKAVITAELQTAKFSESDRIGILTKHLNIFHRNNEVDAFIQHRYVEKSFKEMSIDDPEFRGCEILVGCDLSVNDDISAISYLIIKDDIYYYFNDYYICSEALTTKKNRVRYQEAQAKGQIKIIEGPAIDYSVIINDLVKRNQTHTIKLIAFDPYNAKDFLKQLDAEGFYLVKISQLGATLNGPLKELQRLFLLNKIVLQTSDITAWMFSNVVIKTGYTGLITIDKSNSGTNKVDGVAAMTDALAGYLIAPSYGFHVW